MKVFPEHEVRDFNKRLRLFCEENNVPTCNLPLLQGGIEVSMMAFQHSNEKIVLEVTEKHIDEIVIHTNHEDNG